jgi:hypothetical protein
MTHPLQEIIFDEQGIARFKENKIVRFLIDESIYDMNFLATKSEFSDEDRMQFAQLTGYSVSGFGSLSYVFEEVAYQADGIAEKLIKERELKDEIASGEPHH